MGLLDKVKGIFKKHTSEGDAKLHAIMALAYWNHANKEKKLETYRLCIQESGLYIELGSEPKSEVK